MNAQNASVIERKSRLTAFGEKVARFIRGGKPPPAKRWSSTFVINLVSGTVLVMVLLWQYVIANYSLGLNFQDVKCLPGTVYWTHKTGITANTLSRGTIYTWRSRNLEPVLQDGLPLGKIAAAVPGDHVVVTSEGISINGKFWGALNPIVLTKAKLDPTKLAADYIVAPDEVLMLGTLPRSYDGRYWGPVKISQLDGRSWRLW